MTLKIKVIGFKRTPINDWTCQCWGKWSARSLACKECRADLPCRAEQTGDN